MNLANKLTIFRIILVFIILIIPFFNIQGDILGIPITFFIVDVIFIIASITDKVDGYMTRSRHQLNTFGKFLDPIADKILVIISMMLLIEFGKIPSWIPAIIIMREFIVSGYRLIAVEKKGKVIAASVWGKLKTVTQMIAIMLAFIDKNPFGAIFTMQLTGMEFAINLIVTLMMIICVIATVFSGWDYIKSGKDLLKD